MPQISASSSTGLHSRRVHSRDLSRFGCLRALFSALLSAKIIKLHYTVLAFGTHSQVAVSHLIKVKFKAPNLIYLDGHA